MVAATGLTGVSDAAVVVRIGVLALQGSFREHITSLRNLPDVTPVEIRTKEELATVDGLIIPGQHMQQFGTARVISLLRKHPLNVVTSESCWLSRLHAVCVASMEHHIPDILMVLQAARAPPWHSLQRGGD